MLKVEAANNNHRDVGKIGFKESNLSVVILYIPANCTCLLGNGRQLVLKEKFRQLIHTLF